MLRSEGGMVPVREDASCSVRSDDPFFLAASLVSNARSAPLLLVLPPVRCRIREFTVEGTQGSPGCLDMHNSQRQPSLFADPEFRVLFHRCKRKERVP